MAELDIRVQPRSSRNLVALEGEAVKVWVTAAPTDGEANAAVCEIVAKTLGVAKSRISVIRGHTSRSKRLAVEGLTEAEVREKLCQLPQ